VAAAKRRPPGRRQPTLICCKTVIGMGSPNKAGTHDVHGAPLGAAEVAATREALGWTAAPFEIPADVAPPGTPRRRRKPPSRLAAAL
jgi:transketolase